MSSTKIVIVVLILVAVLFAIFVAKGALSDDQPESRNRNEALQFSKKKQAPGWSQTIKKLFGSVQPKIALKHKRYTSTSEENVAPDNKHSFRTATFKLMGGSAVIEYEDKTEDAPDDLKEQECPLPNLDSDDRERCSIVALKRGGKLTFRCEGLDPCRVDVEQ